MFVSNYLEAMNFRKPFFIFLFVLLNVTACFSQDYFVIENVVRCNATKEPIPYVSIGIKGTSVGTMSNIEGRFMINKLPQTYKADTLFFSHVSFRDTLLAITDLSSMGIGLTPREILLDNIDVSPFGKTQNVDALVLLKKSLENIRHNYHPDFQNYIGEFHYLTTDEISTDTVRHSKGEANVCLPSVVLSRKDKVHYDSLFFDVDKREESLGQFIDSEEERAMCMPFPYDLHYMLIFFSYMAIENSFPFNDQNLKDYCFSISDTLELDNEPVVKIEFAPFEKGRKKYFGDIFLALSDYAIKKIEMHLLRDERNVARTIGLGVALGVNTYNLSHSIYDVDIDLAFTRADNGKLLPGKVWCRAAYNVTGNNNINSNRYISSFELDAYEFRNIGKAVQVNNKYEKMPRINKHLMRRIEKYIHKIGDPELIKELEERF